jgi:DNA-directed RNA polymerase subunit RPC12/RpoP
MSAGYRERLICPTCGRVLYRPRRDDSRGPFGVCPSDGARLVLKPRKRIRRNLGGSRS